MANDKLKFLTEVVMEKGLSVAGDVNVQGTFTAENSEQLLTKGALTVINSENNDLKLTLMGLVMRTGHKNEADQWIDYAIAYDPADDAVRLGTGVYDTEANTFTFNEGEGKPVAVRDLDENDNGNIPVWNGEKFCFERGPIDVQASGEVTIKTPLSVSHGITTGSITADGKMTVWGLLSVKGDKAIMYNGLNVEEGITTDALASDTIKTNKTLSVGKADASVNYSAAFGYGTQAGAKAFTMKSFDKDACTITLDFDPNTEEGEKFTASLLECAAAGYKCSLDFTVCENGDENGNVWEQAFADFCAIKSVMGNVVELEKFPVMAEKDNYSIPENWTAETYIDAATGLDGEDNTFKIADMPTLGNRGLGNASVATGSGSMALAKNAVAMGYKNVAKGAHSIALGRQNETAYASVAAGQGNKAIGETSVALGNGNTARGSYSVAVGRGTTASGHFAMAEGRLTVASGDAAHAEGGNDMNNVLASTHGGEAPVASGRSSHAEGWNTKATGDISHAEGNGTSATATGAHAEGGPNTIAKGKHSHAEGVGTTTTGEGAHAEGKMTQATDVAHAEGYSTKALGWASHTEGNQTKATGSAAHAEGFGTQADAEGAHAEGVYTVAKGKGQHVVGKYNAADTEVTAENPYGKYAVIVGNGANTGARSNAYTLDWNGNAEFAGSVKASGIEAGSLTSNGFVLAQEYVSASHFMGSTAGIGHIDASSITVEDNSQTYVFDGEFGTARANGEWAIDFISNGKKYTKLSVTSYASDSYGEGHMYYEDASSQDQAVRWGWYIDPSYPAASGYTTTWSKEDFRTIQVIGGADAQNPEFLAWMNNVAHKSNTTTTTNTEINSFEVATTCITAGSANIGSVSTSELTSPKAMVDELTSGAINLKEKTIVISEKQNGATSVLNDTNLIVGANAEKPTITLGGTTIDEELLKKLLIFISKTDVGDLAYTVTGKWLWNDTLTITEAFRANVNSIVDTSHYGGEDNVSGNVDCIEIVKDDTNEGLAYNGIGWVGAPEYYNGSWKDQTFRTIDFGSGLQVVSEQFYNFLQTNATKL